MWPQGNRQPGDALSRGSPAESNGTSGWRAMAHRSGSGRVPGLPLSWAGDHVRESLPAPAGDVTENTPFGATVFAGLPVVGYGRGRQFPSAGMRAWGRGEGWGMALAAARNGRDRARIWLVGRGCSEAVGQPDR